MSVSTSHAGDTRARLRDHSQSDLNVLRALSIVAGLGWAVAFIVLGLRFDLQTYGDGSIFAYSVAAQDAWAFHFHNISGRIFVYLFSVAPAEAYVALTGDGRGGIALYGMLFFLPPLIGLMLTYAADRSRGRIVFSYGCASTACLAPLVFGFPTEMWMAHALFWPALAVCHFARSGIAGSVAIFAVLLALIFTHAGAGIFIVSILATLWLRGSGDKAFGRTMACLGPVLMIWLAVRQGIPPDDYFAPVLRRAAWHVFDWTLCIGRIVLLLTTAIAGYGILCRMLLRFTPGKAHIVAALIVATALAGYWVYAYNPVHAERRYYLRTLLVVFTPLAGMLAATFALQSEGLLRRHIPLLAELSAALRTPAIARAVAGTMAIIVLVHVVETGKFIAAWDGYRTALRALASSATSDPAIGDARYVSSQRLGPELNRLSWWSTTPYLSVLVTPTLAPARLVFDPNASYFWLSCHTAQANAAARNAVPQDTRQLIAKYSCLHRR